MRIKIMDRNIDWIDRRDKWLSAVRDLFDTIRTWSESQGWSVHEDEKTISEEHIGRYKVPSLVIQCPSGRIHIDPIGCNIIGAHGRVDILSFPSLNRLSLHQDQWCLENKDGISNGLASRME